MTKEENMIIGIDGNEANVEKRVGISEYAFKLLKQFERFKIYDLRFMIYLKDRPLGDLPKERRGWEYRVIGPNKLWTQIGLPLDLYFHKPRPDVFFTPTHYAPRFSPVPTAISIMDLSYVHYPQLFRKGDLYQLQNWTSYSAQKARKIFTISKASKDDIIKIYGVPKDKIVITYPGIKFKTQMSKLKTTVQNSKLLERYGIEREYVLFVGTLQPRKNIVRLIEAFSRVCHPERSEGSRDISLIIVGKKGWLYEEILEAPRKFGIENRIKFLDFVPNDDLPALYQNALCFVLPSLYEGFGLPVLEAMKNGCPVITSNVSSLPEAGGDAALYIDPLNVSDITAKIKMVLEDDKLRKEMIEKGKKQVSKFSWEKTAKETLKALESIKYDNEDF